MAPRSPLAQLDPTLPVSTPSSPALVPGLLRAPPDTGARGLHELLGAVPLGAPLEVRLGWLEALVGWVGCGLQLAGAPLEQPPAQTRLLLLVRTLDLRPRACEAVSRLVHGVLGEARMLKLLAQVGVPSGQGFVGEVADRVSRQLLPTPPEAPELAAWLPRVFPTADSAAWLGTLPSDALAELGALLGAHAPGEAAARLRAGLLDALVLLAVRTASLGLAPSVMERTAPVPLRQHPFVRLRAAADTVAVLDGAPEALAALQVELERCREVVTEVEAHLETSGVSVELVYRLERITRGLYRMERIARVLGSEPGEARWREAVGLLALLVRRSHEDCSVGALVNASTRQLARKVIERAGATGEHYITQTRDEWHGMVHSAAGGGALTAFTAAFKTVLGHLHLAPFFTGLFASLNYACSFLLLQVMGFTLATKQPSMTAAALAGALADSEGEDAEGQPRRLEQLVDLIARITRSQLAALMGNLSAVLPAAVVLALGVQWVFGRPLVDEAYAHKVLASLHPWRSGTVPFAVLTGLWLWAGSVAGGWLDNWMAYRRVPDALEAHPGLRAFLGARNAERLARFLRRHAAGVGNSVTLGFLLGCTPWVSDFFGLPLEVRHVTLSFGALAFSGVALGPAGVLSAEFLAALAGVGLIGFINFAVSSALALAVALRARDVPRGTTAALARALVEGLRRSPAKFFLPPPGEVRE